MKKKSMWSLKLSTAAIVLIPAAIGINFIGKFFAESLKLPLWLDRLERFFQVCLQVQLLVPSPES